MENLPDDHFVTTRQFVKTVHRDVYPAIDPRAPSNSQAGKVIVITGASRGLGRKVSLKHCRNFCFANRRRVLLPHSPKADQNALCLLLVRLMGLRP